MLRPDGGITNLFFFTIQTPILYHALFCSLVFPFNISVTADAVSLSSRSFVTGFRAAVRGAAGLPIPEAATSATVPATVARAGVLAIGSAHPRRPTIRALPPTTAEAGIAAVTAEAAQTVAAAETVEGAAAINAVRRRKKPRRL